MQTIDGRPVYAATDLVAYLACEHLTQLERAALAGLVKRPMRDDPELDIIRKRGFEHERRFLADLVADGRTADDDHARWLDRGPGRPAARRGRRDDRRDGRGRRRDLQATFFEARGAGTRTSCCASTTRTVPRSGDRGTTRSPTPSSPGTSRPARSSRSAASRPARAASRASAPSGCTSRSGAAHGRSSGSASTTTWRTTGARGPLPRDDDRRGPRDYPPADHVSRTGRALRRLPVGRRMRRPPRGDDHLSLVAGISARQRRALTDRGVPTLEALATLPARRLEPKLEGASAEACSRVRKKARMQIEGRREGGMHSERLPAPGRGRRSAGTGPALLPPPSPWRPLLRSRGRPVRLRGPHGLDYLFGIPG